MSLTSTSSVLLDVNKDRDEYKEFYFQARFATGLILYPIFCVLGLTGNLMGIAVMSQKQIKSSTTVYLVALSISDCIKIVCDAVYFLVLLFMETNPVAGNRLYVCIYPYAHYVFNASLCISAWLTVSIALERYIYVCRPTQVKSYCSVKRARTISTTVFLVMSLASIPYAMRYRTIEKINNTTALQYYDLRLTDLWENKTFSSTFTWMQYCTRSVLPLVLLIGLNACIMYGIRRCRLGRKKHRITVMLIVIIIVFLICITPDAIMSTIFGLGYYEENYLARGIREITDLLLLINTTTNFAIYCIFNSVFWRNFQRLFCSCLLSSPSEADDNEIHHLSLLRKSSRCLSKGSVLGNEYGGRYLTEKI